MTKPLHSGYTEALGQEIVDRLSEGEPLAVICRDEHMPDRRTVGNWRKAHPDFDVAFLAARDDGFDAIAADCLEISDDGRRDYSEDSDGRVVVDHDHIQRSKLRVDTRLKLLAKWDPRRYGERTVLAGDPNAPLLGITDEQLDERLNVLLSRHEVAE